MDITSSKSFKKTPKIYYPILVVYFVVLLIAASG